jgi:hypothetical protein
MVSRTERRLDKLDKMFRFIQGQLNAINTKLNQPNHQTTVQVNTRLNRTITALHQLGGTASATQISELTNRQRASESLNLNELYHSGLATSRFSHREKLFTLKEVNI